MASPGAAPPFVEAFAARRAAARRRLVAVAPEGVLAPAAVDALVDGLGRDLAWLAAPTLLERFRAVPGRRFLDPRARGAHDGYVAALADGLLDEVVAGLPELERLLAACTAAWLWRSGQLLHRLDADRELLGWRFGVTPPFAAAAPVGDGVVRLGGATCPDLVYKPRPLDMEASLHALLVWLDEQDLRLDLPRVPTLDRGAYGYMAYAPQRQPADAAERAGLHVRAGMLLALAHLLGGGDLHAGNLRACGAHPAIVDAEVLLRPRAFADAAGVDDVLATGLLPTPADGGRCGLAAGLAVAGGSPRWPHAGSDAVAERPLRRMVEAPRAALRAHLRDLGPDVVARDVCAGFREVCGVARRRGLPLDLFAGTRPRVLLRSSLRYQEAIEAQLRPARLRATGARVAPAADLVREAPALLRAAPTALLARVAAAEREALRAAEVPRFTTTAEGAGLACGDHLVGAPFGRSPLARAAARVAAASPTAVATWCGTIERSIADAASDAEAPLRLALAGGFAPLS